MPGVLGCDASDRMPVAAFDLDGTIFDGESPVLFVTRLLDGRPLNLLGAVPIIWWGLRYKLHLPYGAGEARLRAFPQLARFSREDVDALCDRLFVKRVAPRLRRDAVSLVERYRRAGVRVVIVSASFEPLVASVARALGVEQLSTRLVVSDGRYTGELAELPLTGDEKPRRLARALDASIGQGAWRLVAAYGDHNSDVPLLSHACNPFAVDPDPALALSARRRGWPVLRWRAHVTAGQLERLVRTNLAGRAGEPGGDSRLGA